MADLIARGLAKKATSDLAQKANESDLANKRDKSTLITMFDLSQDLKTEIDKIPMKENITFSTKNIFNPDDVIVGSSYNSDGSIYINGGHKRTPKYTVIERENISISGIDGIGIGVTRPFLHFWSGEVLHSHLTLPAYEGTNEFSFEIPVGVTHFSFNINKGVIPSRLQVERNNVPTFYEPYKVLSRGVVSSELEGKIYVQSSKNLYDGTAVSKLRVLNSGVIQTTANDNDTLSSFVPVELGNYYTISGLDDSISASNRWILGFSSKFTRTSGFVKSLGSYNGDSVTVYIDDPNIKYIIFPVTNSTGIKTYTDALNNYIQVEKGQYATSYEPYRYIKNVQKTMLALEDKVSKKLADSSKNVLTEFIEMNKVRSTSSEVAILSKDVAPLGFMYSITGETTKEHKGNTLYATVKVTKSGKRQVFLNIANYIGGNVSAGKIQPTAFTVPSGQLDNPETLSQYDTQYNKDEYCHPDIAYDAVGVAGYKYWMITSILPSKNLGDVKWEDEDLFVSNDAKTWLRVKSLYESAKTYTTPSLSLPPQSLATNNARKHGFLPCPANGDSIEISVPADNGAPALDRVNITLTQLPWKHDPAILIDGGYVYTYHSFHLPYADRDGGKNRFIVCVRTNNGIDWEVVRNDGSTMLLTEETSRQIFTKDEQGRYNYMYYSYSTGNMNPTILKYGTGDYEMVYGANYSFRVKGATPYNFDFSTEYPFDGKGSGNHPGLLLDGSNLYLLNHDFLYVSTDRGATFSKYNNYPAWKGGFSGINYKKALCKGVGGKVILVEVQRYVINSANLALANSFTQTNNVHQMYLYEYTSVADFTNKAQNGLIDGYVDVQIAKVNFSKQTRNVRFYPYLSNTSTTAGVNVPLQRLKIADIQVEEGETLLFYVTLNSRNGAKIVFGGIDII